MGNKLISLATKGSIWLASIFFITTIVQYHIGCSDRTLIYWSLLTIVMYILHVIFRIGNFEYETFTELADIKMMIANDEYRSNLKYIMELVDKMDKAEKE